MTSTLTDEHRPQCKFTIYLNAGKVITTEPEVMRYIDANILARQMSKCDMVAEVRLTTSKTRVQYINGGYGFGEQIA